MVSGSQYDKLWERLLLRSFTKTQRLVLRQLCLAWLLAQILHRFNDLVFTSVFFLPLSFKKVHPSVYRQYKGLQKEEHESFKLPNVIGHYFMQHNQSVRVSHGRLLWSKRPTFWDFCLCDCNFLSPELHWRESPEWWLQPIMLWCELPFHFIQNNICRFVFDETEQEPTDILLDHDWTFGTLFDEALLKNAVSKSRGFCFF